MSYPEVIKYLESFVNYELIPAYPYKESLKLERIKGFLSTINNPQKALRCIHVAGTKGKGSTCAFIAYILREAGYNVGLYTSPHLSDFRERIRILRPQAIGHRPETTKDFEGMIRKSELAHLVKRLKPAIEQYNRKSHYGPLSFFEGYTALAFVYFKEKKVDFAVLETGLGGRLDATNVVDSLASVLTPISYEHTQKLGNTLTKIATEKAGIIKGHKSGVTSQASIVITAPQEKEAIKVIRDRCKKMGAKLYEVDKDITYKKRKDTFSIKGIFDEYPALKIRLIGKHQLANAAVSVGAIEALRHYNISVGIDSIRRGLYNTCWPGRCEVIAKNPLVILDGAQNIASISALKEALREKFSASAQGRCASGAKGGSLSVRQAGASGGKYKKLILILGISCDKDIKEICGQLYGLASTVILTKADNPRATSPYELAKYFKGQDVCITDNVREAKIQAYRKALKEDLILVTGSLFVVGEFRNEHT